MLVHPTASKSEVARELGLDRRTVQRALAGRVEAAAPVRKPPPVTPVQSSLLDSAPPVPRKKSNGVLVPTEAFLRWWGEYPIKRNRYKAWAEWRKQKLDGHVDALVEALQYQIKRKSEIRTQGRFVEEFPHGERYIRDKRWHDEF
jgi:hypothetical protein